MYGPEAWLEGSDGRRWPVAATCSIGRSSSNDIVLDDGWVSRRHALVHKQDAAEFWVIDLGSGNGTYHNGRRLTMPTRLNDRDTLGIGQSSFTFRQGLAAPQRSDTSPSTEQTFIQVKTLQCWLLVADIRGSTALAQRLPTTELAVLVGKWMAACKEIIEQRGGTINKYLGDGFLAFWFADDKGTAGISAAVDGLIAIQRTGEDPRFRIVLHQGLVTFGAGGSGGEDSLSGPDVIRVFRMEKLASALGREVLLSEEAQSSPGLGLSLREAGTHQLEGFDGKTRRFYTLA